VVFHVDYCAFTIHSNYASVCWILFESFPQLIPDGGLISRKFGGLGYRYSEQGLAGLVVYNSMREDDSPETGGLHCHIVLKGDACDCVTLRDFGVLFSECKRWGLRLVIKRIDLAFDGVGFTPRQFFRACVSGRGMRCAGKRSTIRWLDTPLELREDLVSGCQTAYVGKHSSERMVRVYNKHGYTRLELELHDEWAGGAFEVLVGSGDAAYLARGLVDDYVSFKARWWRSFMSGAVRVELRRGSSEASTLDKKLQWLHKQVTPTLRAIGDYSIDTLLALVASGKSDPVLSALFRGRYELVDNYVVPDGDEWHL